MLTANTRKIAIIESRLGKDWAAKNPGMSLDAVYRLAIKDNRKAVYLKIDHERKQKFAELLRHFDTTGADLMAVMIDAYYDVYQEEKKKVMERMVQDYSTGIS